MKQKLKEMIECTCGVSGARAVLHISLFRSHSHTSLHLRNIRIILLLSLKHLLFLAWQWIPHWLATSTTSFFNLFIYLSIYLFLYLTLLTVDQILYIDFIHIKRGLRYGIRSWIWLLPSATVLCCNINVMVPWIYIFYCSVISF